jgi:hypothetical protein
VASLALPPMPWHPEEFLVLTAHWAHAERAALRALADYQWIQGVLPKEHDRLARLIGIAPDEFEKLWPFLSTQFSEVEGGLQNPQIESRRNKALRLQRSHIKGARTAHANRRAQKDAEHITQQQQTTKSATDEKDAENVVTIAAPSSSSLRDLSLSSSEESVPRGAPSPTQAWRNNPGLNVEAFEAYLDHLEVLLKRGSIRSRLPPHSQFEQARWLAVQGPPAMQFEIVRAAIRNGWKMLQPQATRAAPSSRKPSFDELHSNAEKR